MRISYFGERLRLFDVTPHHLAQFVGWLADPIEAGMALDSRTGRSETSLLPSRAALATAKREGLIRDNPATGLALPATDRSEEDEEEVKVLSREQLRALLDLAPVRYRLLFELIASTGLRISEAVGLQAKHLRPGRLQAAPPGTEGNRQGPGGGSEDAARQAISPSAGFPRS